VKGKYGFKLKSCWIANAKEHADLPVKRAWNRIGDKRKNPCPPEEVGAIMDALLHFGMIE